MENSKIEERAKAYADNYVVGDFAIIVDLIHKVAEESYIAGANEQKEIDRNEFKEYLEKRLCDAKSVYEMSHHEDYVGGFMDAISELINELFKEDNFADASKINPLLAECLSEVNPDTRAEVRKNMDADHFRDDRKSPLTWQDVQRICRLEAQVAGSFEFGDADKVSGKEFYTEVLKRFNEQL